MHKSILPKQEEMEFCVIWEKWQNAPSWWFVNNYYTTNHEENMINTTENTFIHDAVYMLFQDLYDYFQDRN